MPGPDGRTRICIVAAVPITLSAFIAPHVKALARRYHVTLAASGSDTRIAAMLGEDVRFCPVPISRRISPLADLRALVRLWWLFRRQQFDLVQSITPKAGLLAMVAARLAGVPLRIHWFTGQVWATKRGLARGVLKAVDRVLARSATHLLADSPSQRAFLIEQHVVAADRVAVLADGSVAGVDMSRFQPNDAARAAVRTTLKIPEQAIVALYLGRLTRDKGVLELAAAFALAAQTSDRLHLLLVGPDEEHLQPAVVAMAAAYGDRVHFVGETETPDAFMAAADFFVLASHREGFGSTIIEAAACGIPAIGTRIYGITDAIADGVSGLLVPLKDIGALAAAMNKLAKDEAARAELGKRAYERAKALFTQPRVTQALCMFYDDLLRARTR